jgi:hypothetical protein
MRIKAIILSAAFGAVGIATSMGQVYSQNGVGYYNLDLPMGFSMIANQLNITGGNTLDAILPNVPVGTTVAKFDSSAQSFLPDDTFYGTGWFDAAFQPSTTTLDPGEGAFINMAEAGTVTFVGEIPQGEGATALSTTIPPLFSILSALTPQAASLAATGLPASVGDTIAFYDNGVVSGTPGFLPDITFYGGATGTGWFNADFSPADPTPAVGESFFYNSAAATSVDWTRDFSIND